MNKYREKGDRIRDMFAYVRMWLLLFALRRRCLRENARITRERKEAEQKGETTGGSEFRKVYVHPYDEFLENQVNKAWFGICSLLSQHQHDLLIEKYAACLSMAQEKDYIEIGNHDGSWVINILPSGNFFAEPMNGLAGFLREYKVVFYAIISVALFLNSWSITLYGEVIEWWNEQHTKEISQPAEQSS